MKPQHARLQFWDAQARLAMMKTSMEVQLWSLGSTWAELPIALLWDISIYIVFVASGCWKQPSAKYWRGGLSIGLVWKPQDLKRFAGCWHIGECVFARNWLFCIRTDLPSKMWFARVWTRLLIMVCETNHCYVRVYNICIRIILSWTHEPYKWVVGVVKVTKNPCKNMPSSPGNLGSERKIHSPAAVTGGERRCLVALKLRVRSTPKISLHSARCP